MISTEELLRLADLHFAESHREHARFTDSFAVIEEPGFLLASAGTRSPVVPFNVAMRVGPHGGDPVELLDRARSFFSARQRGFSVQTRAHLDGDLIAACERSGFPCVTGRAPGMVLTERSRQVPLRADVRCHVIGEADAEDFLRVASEAYETAGLPAGVTRKFFSQTRRWLAPHCRVHVLYEADEPVACGMVLHSHGIAGIHWVGTLPRMRGRGHAATLMAAMDNRAFDEGARALVLQASVMGESVYRRMGWREITEYPSFVATTP